MPPIIKKGGDSIKKRKAWNEGMMDESLLKHPKVCPQLECGSKEVKFRMFANQKLSQPRYYCKKCEQPFTLGGRVYNRKAVVAEFKNAPALKTPEAEVIQDETTLYYNNNKVNNNKPRVYKKKAQAIGSETALYYNHNEVPRDEDVGDEDNDTHDMNSVDDKSSANDACNTHDMSNIDDTSTTDDEGKKIPSPLERAAVNQVTVQNTTDTGSTDDTESTDGTSSTNDSSNTDDSSSTDDSSNSAGTSDADDTSNSHDKSNNFDDNENKDEVEKTTNDTTR